MNFQELINRKEVEEEVRANITDEAITEGVDHLVVITEGEIVLLLETLDMETQEVDQGLDLAMEVEIVVDTHVENQTVLIKEQTRDTLHLAHKEVVTIDKNIVHMFTKKSDIRQAFLYIY